MQNARISALTLPSASAAPLQEWFAESDNALIVSEYVQGGEVLEARSTGDWKCSILCAPLTSSVFPRR